MSKNLANLRFAVADEKYGHSGIWRLWVTKHDDIYLSTHGMGGVCKVSFHNSGICRYAFTSEYASAHQIKDRLHHKWQRPHIPEPKSNQFSKLCWIAIPTNYLSHFVDDLGKDTIRVPAADSPGTTFIEIGLTRDSEITALATAGTTVKWSMLMWVSLSSDVNVFVRWYHGEESIGDVSMPASHGQPGYRFAHPELKRADRPIRLQMQNKPANHDCLPIVERGGCRID